MGNTYKVELSEDKKFSVRLEEDKLFLNDEVVNLDIAKTGKEEWSVIQNNQSFTVKLLGFDVSSKQIKLSVNGEIFTSTIENKLDLLLNEMGMSRGGSTKMVDVKAPMPGLVLEVIAKVGQTISIGDPLLILEAMKMENVLKASGEGTIKSILIKNQDTVEKNQVLIEME